MPIWRQLLLLMFLAGFAYGGKLTYEAYFAPATTTQTPTRTSKPISVEVAEAQNRIINQTVEAVGTTRALKSVEIVPHTEGRVVELNITPGKEVTSQTVLARLDDTIERANLSEAEARLTEQTQSMKRIEQLRSTNSVSQATLEEGTARLAEARADLERAHARLKERNIRAPFTGVAGLAEIDLGTRLNQGDMITRLDDLSRVVLEFSLPETLFTQVRPGQLITAKATAFADQEFAGTIMEVNNRVDPLSRSFRVRASIPNPERILPAGMFMSLSLVLSQSEELTVPEEAIIFQSAATYIFRIHDGKATRQRVNIGERRNGIVAILSGLEVGDLVATRGLQRLRDGKDVKVLNTPDIMEKTQVQQDSDS